VLLPTKIQKDLQKGESCHERKEGSETAKVESCHERKEGEKKEAKSSWSVVRRHVPCRFFATSLPLVIGFFLLVRGPVSSTPHRSGYRSASPSSRNPHPPSLYLFPLPPLPGLCFPASFQLRSVLRASQSLGRFLSSARISLGRLFLDGMQPLSCLLPSVLFEFFAPLVSVLALVRHALMPLALL
jgi:hypothetical protein